MRISDWSSDVCSSDLPHAVRVLDAAARGSGQAPDPERGARPQAGAHPQPGRGARRVRVLRQRRRVRAERVASVARGGDGRGKIGRESWRESVGPDVWISVVAGSLKKKKKIWNK